MSWYLQRFQDIFTGYYPHERKVCAWAFVIRCGFILAPALAWWEWSRLWELYGSWQIVRGMLTLGTGWLGAFVWADLGPEEWFTKRLIGYANNYNMTPNGRLEGFCGAVDVQDAKAWEQHKHQILRPWDGEVFE